MYEVERYVQWDKRDFKSNGPMYEAMSYHTSSMGDSVEDRVRDKLVELEDRVERMLLKLVSVKSKSLTCETKSPQSSILPKDIAIRVNPEESVLLVNLLDAVIAINSNRSKVGYLVYYHSSCLDSDRDPRIKSGRLNEMRGSYDFIFSLVITRQGLAGNNSSKSKPSISCVTCVKPLSMNEIYGASNLCRLIARCFAESLYPECDPMSAMKIDHELTEIEHLSDARAASTYVKKRITGNNFSGYFCGNIITVVDLFIFCKLLQHNLLAQFKNVKNFDSWFMKCRNVFGSN